MNTKEFRFMMQTSQENQRIMEELRKLADREKLLISALRRIKASGEYKTVVEHDQGMHYVRVIWVPSEAAKIAEEALKNVQF